MGDYMHKHILIATDGSKVSTKAALEGIDLAREHGSIIIGVHILDEEALNIMDVGSDEYKKRLKLQKDKGEKALESLEKLASSSGVKIEKVIRMGEPVKELIKISDEYSADLIVMGTHGRDS
jgi:nucleotide-binding universal stress UspA family protein